MDQTSNQSKSTCVSIDTNTNSGDLIPTAFRVIEKKYKMYKDIQPHSKTSRSELSVSDTQPITKERLKSKDKNMNLSSKTYTVRATDYTDVLNPRDLDSNTPYNQSLAHSLFNPIPNLKLGTEFYNVVSDNSKSSVNYVLVDSVPGLILYPRLLSVELQQKLCAMALTQCCCSDLAPNNITNLAKQASCGQQGAITCGYRRDIRWATLGRHYNWTSKTYNPGCNAIPPLIVDLCHDIVAMLPTELGYPSGVRPVQTKPRSYEPQTVIVNYYPVGTAMMGHQDVSEECLHQPLVSLSLGASCVFLAGTASRGDAPTAFRLCSGDVAVFTGPSRRSYHGVPRILDDCPRHLLDIPAGLAPPLSCTHQHPSRTPPPLSMESMRVNMNVRQIYFTD